MTLENDRHAVNRACSRFLLGQFPVFQLVKLVRETILSIFDSVKPGADVWISVLFDPLLVFLALVDQKYLQDIDGLVISENLVSLHEILLLFAFFRKKLAFLVYFPSTEFTADPILIDLLLLVLKKIVFSNVNVKLFKCKVGRNVVFEQVGHPGDHSVREEVIRHDPCVVLACKQLSENLYLRAQLG